MAQHADAGSDDTRGRARSRAHATGPADETATQADVRRFRQAAAVVFRRLRSEGGWSYREFSERVGIAHTSLHAVERADQTPSIETLSLVAQACGVSFLDVLSSITAQVVVEIEAERTSPSASAADAAPAAMRIDLLRTVLALSTAQQAELLRFASWLTWRDDASGADTPQPE